MLIPRFTLRSLFVVTTFVAVLALIASWAGQGIPWAVGVTAAVVALVAAMLLHTALFGLIWLFSEITSAHRAASAPTANKKKSDQ